jgi:integrase
MGCLWGGSAQPLFETGRRQPPRDPDVEVTPGTFTTSCLPARAVERTLKRAGLDQQGLSSHTFRHTFASLLIVGLKLDPVSVAGQLGHSNPATTLRFYAHLFEKAKHADEARDALSKGFGHLLASSS